MFRRLSALVSVFVLVSTISATTQIPLRVGGDVPAPTKTKDVAPVYPAEALQARIHGIVIFEVTVDPAGKTQSVRILRSIPSLDQAATAAVKQWEYTPTVVNGVPRSVVMTVTVEFKLSADAPASSASVAGTTWQCESDGSSRTFEFLAGGQFFVRPGFHNDKPESSPWHQWEQRDASVRLVSFAPNSIIWDVRLTSGTTMEGVARSFDDRAPIPRTLFDLSPLEQLGGFRCGPAPSQTSRRIQFENAHSQPKFLDIWYSKGTSSGVPESCDGVEGSSTVYSPWGDGRIAPQGARGDRYIVDCTGVYAFCYRWAYDPAGEMDSLELARRGAPWQGTACVGGTQFYDAQTGIKRVPF